MTLTKNQVIKVNITSMSSDGNGIAKYDGITVFVPFSAVGDVLEVKVVKLHKTYVFAIISDIIAPSESRVAPECKIYGKCGGCCFAHMTYEAELLAKHAFVEHAMQRIGNINTHVNNVLPSPNKMRYRNKVQYPVCEVKGSVQSGFYASRSHRIIPCDDCLLQPKMLNEIAKTCCCTFENYGVKIYDEETNTGLLRHIYLRHAEKSGKVLLCLVINGKSLPNESFILNDILTAHPQIETVVININTNRTNVILGKKCKTIHGNGFIKDELCGVPVKLGAMSFYQVNTQGAELLYKTAADMAQLSSNDVLLDLYCGTGTIGLAVMKRTQCKKLVGVEIIPEAVESAKQNALQMGVDNAHFICASTSSAVQTLIDSKLLPTAVVLDPPRKGCDEITLSAVVEMAPKKIIMISCNVATAARDVKYLSSKGYTVFAITPVDLFPRTKHIECVVLMSRVDK